MNLLHLQSQKDRCMKSLKKPNAKGLMIARPLLTGAIIASATWLSPIAAANPQANCPTVINHTATLLLDDKPQSLCQFRGKVVLIVNTASRCGFTPQYEALERVHQKYKDQGLVVLGFPANDFGGQEKGSNEEIAKFCKMNFGVTFPLYQKLQRPIVSDPLFAGLTRASGQSPQWNFHKYLISRDGKVQSFESGVIPTGTQMSTAIEAALREPIPLAVQAAPITLQQRMQAKPASYNSQK